VLASLSPVCCTNQWSSLPLCMMCTIDAYVHQVRKAVAQAALTATTQSNGHASSSSSKHKNSESKLPSFEGHPTSSLWFEIMKETTSNVVRRPVSGDMSSIAVLGIEQQLEQYEASSSSSNNSTSSSNSSGSNSSSSNNNTSSGSNSSSSNGNSSSSGQSNSSDNRAAAAAAVVVGTAQLAAATTTTTAAAAAVPEQRQYRADSKLVECFTAAAAGMRDSARERTHTGRSKVRDPATSPEAFDAALLQAVTASTTAAVHQQASSELAASVAHPQASDCAIDATDRITCRAASALAELLLLLLTLSLR
jgi:hypothetical protein